MHRTVAYIAACVAFAGLVHAHAGTKDPTVKAWMANMKEIGAETKTLGLMARGETVFDAAAADRALAEIEALSQKIPSLFEIPADDPTSEARDLIWTDWANYEAEAANLTTVAETARITEQSDLIGVVQALGETCKSCHGKYRD